MNRYILILLLFIGPACFSQRPNFVYIQSEPAQPFNVKLGEQTFQSSRTGYLILSKLTDTSYQIIVSFPSTLWPEQHFTLSVNHTDKGYLLKDFGDKGWGLMDWRKLTVQYSIVPQPSVNAALNETEQAKEDDFASLLAKASGDPSLNARVEKKETVTDKEPAITKVPATAKDSIVARKDSVTFDVEATTDKKTDPLIAKQEMSPVKDSSTVAAPAINVQHSSTNITTVQPSLTKDESLPTTPLSNSKTPTSIVTRRAESSTTEGFGLVYIDKYANGQADTIRLIIPNKAAAIPPTVELPKHCKELATDEQSSFLKTQLLAQLSDDKKLESVRPLLELRCYTVTQIREFSKLFSTDDGKYNFLLEAWSHVSDRSVYITLATVFATKETADRFKEMVQ